MFLMVVIPNASMPHGHNIKTKIKTVKRTPTNYCISVTKLINVQITCSYTVKSRFNESRFNVKSQFKE